MPDAFYNVLEILPEDQEIIEPLGSKPKFWFVIENDPQKWLFKFTRDNTGEAWSEKIACEVAEVLDIPHARVELARFGKRMGCASRSFVERPVDEDCDLVHGSEILAGRFLDYDKTVVRGQCHHTLDRIIEAVGDLFASEQDEPLRMLAGYIFLDALICNTDRHHDNWGLLRAISSDAKMTYRLAPSYDHASSMGREHRDEERDRIIREGRMNAYAFKGTGGIYWGADSKKGENPLRLFEKALQQYPQHFRYWIAKLDSLGGELVHDIIQRMPDDWMSESARQFCKQLLEVTTTHLKGLARR